MTRSKTWMAPAVAAAIIALAQAAPAWAQTHTLRVGTVLAASDPLVIAAEGMKKAIEEKSKGALRVQIFPTSQLGDTQDMMDQAAAGANVGTFVEASRVAVHVREFNSLVAPYVFESPEQIATFAETPLFKSWNDQLVAKAGVTLLSFNWYQGARNMLTKKAVATPADLKGVRVRTIGEPMWIKTINLMGATATPMAWAEVYPSIQTGAIDGAEAQPSAIWGARLYEVVSHITLTEHIFLMSGLLVGDKWLKSLPADLRALLMAEAKTWGASALKANVDGADRIFGDIRAKGVTVTKVDKKPFRDAVQPVYQDLGLVQTIDAVKKAL